MQYYVYYDDGERGFTECGSNAEVREFINGRINAIPHRTDADYTVINGEELYLNTKDVTQVRAVVWSCKNEPQRG